MKNLTGRKLLFAVSVLITFLIFIFGNIYIVNPAGVAGEEIYEKSQAFTAEDGVEKIIPVEVSKTENTAPDDSVIKLHANTVMNTAGDAGDYVWQGGVGVFTNSSYARFSYRNPIDFSTVGKDVSLIELYVLEGKDYAQVSEMTITFTDVKDPSNTFSIYSWANFSHPDSVIYTRVNYQGKSLGLSNETAETLIFDSQYGTVCWGWAFKASASAMYPVSVSFDYENRQLLANCSENRQFVLLDLDDPIHVGKGYEWNGFGSGEALMSVSINYTQAKKGGVIIKSVLGNNLDGNFTSSEDFPAPQITLSTDGIYGDVMPEGAVGEEYALPKAKAFDWFFGKTNDDKISVKVYKENLGEHTADCSQDIADGNFVPRSSGKYRIVYRADNPERYSERYLDINIEEQIFPIVIVQEEEYKTPRLMETFVIPETYYYGGSGIVTKTETLYYNGEEIPLNDSRTVVPDKTGTISLKVECKGYTGEAVIRYFNVEVEGGIVLTVSGVPVAVASGESVTLPQAEAYISDTGEKLNVSVTVYGHPSDGVLVTDKTQGTVRVTYTAADTSGRYGNAEKSYDIPVISADKDKPSCFMSVTAGDVFMQDTDTGIEVYPKSEASVITWAYPVITGYSGDLTKIVIETVKGKSSPNYIDVVLKDYYDDNSAVFFRIFLVNETGENATYMQVNGKGERYMINGTAEASGGLNMFIKAGEIFETLSYSSVCELNGYSADVSEISFRFGGVSGDSCIKFKALANQSLISEPKDNSPVIMFSENLEKLQDVVLGTTVKLPGVKSYDMFSSGSEITLKTFSPDKELILEQSDPSQGAEFTAQAFGSYEIMYTVSDSDGNTSRYYYYVNVIDIDGPTLTIKNKVPEKVKAGDKIVIPEASAKDDVDGDTDVFIYVKRLWDGSITMVEPGQDYYFAATGEYKLVFFTRDGSYNYTRYETVIIAEE